MADRVNQHFVPQYYFKLFSKGEKDKKGRSYIHVFLPASNKIVPYAAIKHQCARKNFYGDPTVEAIFAQLEGRHRTALQFFIDAAWSDDPRSRQLPMTKSLALLWEAILFQRARTKLEVEKHRPAIEHAYLESFKNFMIENADSANSATLLSALSACDSGEVQITEDSAAIAMTQVEMALQNVLLISDLDFVLLRNQTEYEFAFSDSPVVFTNTYCQNIDNLSVLGLTQPGLQIFYPLDAKTVVMLFDGDIYRGSHEDRFFIDLHHRSDVSKLNALQLHHHFNAVYFADESSAMYITDLWQAHGSSVIPPREKRRVDSGWYVNGKPLEDIDPYFEPQPNITLDLSFITCDPIAASDYKFRRRSPELYEQVRATDNEDDFE